MQFIERWLMPTEIEGPERGILEGYGLLASMPRQGSMVSLTAV
jgi:hypothetical protein